jgi:hypothetical protein
MDPQMFAAYIGGRILNAIFIALAVGVGLGLLVAWIV